MCPRCYKLFTRALDSPYIPVAPVTPPTSVSLPPGVVNNGVSEGCYVFLRCPRHKTRTPYYLQHLFYRGVLTLVPDCCSREPRGIVWEVRTRAPCNEFRVEFMSDRMCENSRHRLANAAEVLSWRGTFGDFRGNRASELKPQPK